VKALDRERLRSYSRRPRTSLRVAPEQRACRLVAQPETSVRVPTSLESSYVPGIALAFDMPSAMDRFPLVSRALALLLVAASVGSAPMLAAVTADIPFRDRFAAALKLAPPQACERLASLLAEDPPEEDRRACIVKLRELLPAAAEPLTPEETALVGDLRAQSSTVAEVLVGRYAIVLATADFARNAKSGGLVTQLDLAYILERDLFAVDPVAKVGHRYVLFPDKNKTAGWTTQSRDLIVHVGQDAATHGAWEDVIAHEMNHGFGFYSPARAMFGGGFFEGWGDLAQAYVCERLAFLGAPFAGRFAYYAGAFAESGKSEYLNTRLPIEEIIGYGPSSSLFMRLVLPAGDGKKTPDWKPFKRYFHEALATPPAWTPGYMWPAALARDLLRIFGGERTWDVLAEYRFPLDQASRRELEVWLERARKPMSRLERWKADGEIALRDWKVLGPIPDPDGRHLAFDPLDAENVLRAENFVAREYVIGGKTYTWRTDVPVSEDGIVDLSALPESSGSCVFYLAGAWPRNEAPPVSFSIASDDEVAVWLDGELIDWFRGNRGTFPDDPDRVFARAKKDGGVILAEVANHGGKAGFHLRASTKTPFEYAYRLELRSPDTKRREAAVRFLGSRRIATAPPSNGLVVDALIQALDDGEAIVRVAAARALAGKRNDARVLAALLKRFSIEKDDAVSPVLESALEELTFQRFESSDAAYKWWRHDEKTWRQSSFVECEYAFALQTINGGFFGNNAGAYGGQCVARCWGEKPDQSMSLVLDVPQSGPRTFALRYATVRENARVSLRLKRGDEVVIARDDIALAPVKDWSAWSWLELPLGELKAGRYHVELVKPNGCIDCDVMGLKPTPVKNVR
jgi:hypothetical protein